MLTTYRTAIRQFNPDVRLLLITHALIGFCYGGIYVMLFNLYLLRLGYDLAFIGLINGLAQMGVALFSLSAGSLGRRWGSRRMLIIGIGAAVVGLGLLPLAEWLPAAWQSGWLVSMYVLAWLGGVLYLVNNNPYLMAATNHADRQHVFSVREASMPLLAFGGSLVGGLLPGFFSALGGGTLDQPAPYRYALFLAAALLTPAVWALMATRKAGSAGTSAHPQAQPQQPTRRAAPFGLISFIALVVCLQVVGNSSANTFFSVYLDDGLQIPTASIGLLAGLGRLLAVPAALVTPLLVSRWGQGRTILIGILGLAGALLPLALIPHWGAVGIGFMGVSALFAFTAPTFAIYQQELVPAEWRSTMAGAMMMTTGLSTVAVAFGGGYLITAYGYQRLFLISAGLTALGGLLFWGYTRSPARVPSDDLRVNLPAKNENSSAFRVQNS